MHFKINSPVGDWIIIQPKQVFWQAIYSLGSRKFPILGEDEEQIAAIWFKTFIILVFVDFI